MVVWRQIISLSRLFLSYIEYIWLLATSLVLWQTLRRPIGTMSTPSFMELPDELIVEVVRQNDGYKDVIALLATCTRLKSIIVDLEEFWANIPADVLEGSVTAWELFLYRAGSTPLTMPDVLSSGLVSNRLVSQLHRTRNLSTLLIQDDDVWEYILALDAIPVPFLEYIDISAPHYQQMAMHLDCEWAISKALFCGSCPRLATARIGCFAVRGIPKAPLLHTLELVRTSTSIAQLRDILKHLPNLRDLTLFEIAPWWGFDEADTNMANNEPREALLQSQIAMLSITDTTHYVRKLLQIIPQPTTSLGIFRTLNPLNQSETDAVNDNDPHVLDYLGTFWKNTSGHLLLPNASIFIETDLGVFKTSTTVVSEGVAKHQSTGVQIKMQYALAFMSVTCPISAIPLIDGLRVKIDKHGWGQTDRGIFSELSLTVLAGVQYLTILNTTLLSHDDLHLVWEEQAVLRSLLGWLKTRRARSEALTSISFKSCGESMWPFFIYLRDTGGLADRFAWVA
jgi:hypothetical protein